jgi:hypothetical protein
MSPKDFIERLSTIAQDARHHPEPAVAVALLAQLLLDLAVQLEPLADKFSLLLKASGFPGDLAGALDQVHAELASTGVMTEDGVSAAIAAYEAGGGDQDSTGTAG